MHRFGPSPCSSLEIDPSNKRFTMMMSMPVTTSIDSTRTIESNHGEDKFTVYQITIRNLFNQITHTIDRRYREFENLHTRLASLISLPHLPRKVLLHRRSAKLIEQRRQLLEIYLNEILRRCQQQSIMPEELARFLQLPPFDNEQSVNYRQDFQMQQSSEEELINDETKYVLEHAPCISITDFHPWNNAHRELLTDSVLAGLLHSMYEM